MKAIAILSIPLLLLAGCAGGRLETPAGYQELADVRPLDYKAVSAEGCAIHVRSCENPKDAKLEFVAAACRNHLTRAKGYRLEEETEVTSKGGLKGQQMLFSHEAAGVQRLYLLTCFARGGVGGRLIFVEAGGEKERFQKDLPAVREAVLTLK